MNTMQLFEEEYTATDYAVTKSLFLVWSNKLNVYRCNSLLKTKALNFSVTEVTLICVKKKFITTGNSWY